MTYEIGVYRAERDAGLEQIIRTSTSIVTASLLKIAEKHELSPKAIASIKLNTIQKATAGLDDFDLHYLDTLLVSTGWNKNFDVFDVTETWLARATPTFKPFNYEHDSSDIIGTMISSKAVNVEGVQIADDTNLDDLPKKLHLVTGGVLWKVWDNQVKQERMDSILVEITKAEWFVSMECLFKGFDYALRSETDGTTRVVARNDQSAFLSKYLTAYGGTGKYNGHTVGRLLRNIVFSGKGLVRNPANPESIIIDPNNEPFVVTKTEATTDFTKLLTEQVYSSLATVDSQLSSTKEPNTMAIEVSVLEKQLEAARAEIDTLKASLKENDTKVFQATIATLQKDLATATEFLAKEQEARTKAEQASAAASNQVALLSKEKEELCKTEADIRLELKTIYAEKTKAERLNKLAVAMNVDLTNAEATKTIAALNDTLATLTPEQFSSYVATATKFVAPVTPVVPTVKATVTTEEEDPAAKNADTALLDNAKANKTEPNLTVSPSDGVKKLSKGIAAFCGLADETK